MKKIKLMSISTLVLLLPFALVPGRGSPQAGSKSSTFELTSDLLCGTGGGTGSANFTLSRSAGGQSSPVGSQFSASLSVGGGWVYTTATEFVRGDANGDQKIDLGDVIYNLNFLFKSGSSPCPRQAGDTNCDGTVDLGDVVYLLNYLFKGGPAPCPGRDGEVMSNRIAKLKVDRGHARIWLSLDDGSAQHDLPYPAQSTPQTNDGYHEISVMAKFDRDLAGVQLEIEFDQAEAVMLDPVGTSVTKNLQLFSGAEDGVQKIGMVDLSGGNLISAGEGALVKLRMLTRDLTTIKIKKALLVDEEAMALVSEVSEQLNLNPIETTPSKPECFSLSQNYPNPFNPQTSISYALPQDAHVRVTVYNLLGQKVATLVDEHQTAGYKTVWWDGTDESGDQVASGVYFYSLEAGKFSDVKKMMLVK